MKKNHLTDNDLFFEYANVFDEILTNLQELSAKFWSYEQKHPMFGIFDLHWLCSSYHTTLCDSFDFLWRDSTYCLENYHNFVSDCFALFNDSENFSLPFNKDERRFRHKLWQENYYFYLIKQYYLLVSKYVTAIFDSFDYPDPLKGNQVKFYMQLWLETISPSNFFWTNPEVMQLSHETNGLSVIKGIRNYLSDLNTWHGYLQISKSQKSSFVIGKDIACTKGDIIFQNEIMQLIHYQTTATTVHQHPILIVTSWINKYYILDLQPHNSLAHWLIEQGFDVFIISWRNPDETCDDRNFADYVLQGPVAALEIIRDIHHQAKINVIGFCLGGTLLSSAIAYLHARDQHWVKSLTLLASLLDFSEPGQFKNFTGDEQFKFFKDSNGNKTYWSGKKLATAFNLLRSNEFIWPFFIRNYLQGEDPINHPLLFWFQDFTNSPMSLYLFYMKELLRKNLLPQNKIKIGNQILDLNSVTVPCYYLGLTDDHVSPWLSTFHSAKLLSGEVHFVLADAGHVAGIVNSPKQNKYCYWSGEIKQQHNPEEWQTLVERQAGSWWHDWLNWSKPHQGDAININTLKKYPSFETAPGTYALKMIE